MHDQPTIFDETFDEGVKIRRRALMPFFLKIYLIVFTLYAAYQVFGRSYYMYKITNFYVRNSLFGVSDLRVSMMIVRSFFGGAILVVAVLSLWMEWKWAIRYNWGLLFLSITMSVVDYVAGNGYTGYLGMVAVLVAPYYSMLYQIQKQWEREAVSGRALRHTK
jgi:hypothetical protein